MTTLGSASGVCCVPVEEGTLETFTYGDAGPLVVMVPSLGRGADDFRDLAGRVAAAGFRVACPQPRGIGASGPLPEQSDLRAWADDVVAVIDALAGSDERAVVVGHAFGNRVARMTAAAHPDRVAAVALLACGGLVPPAPAVGAALFGVFDETVDRAAHLAAVRTAFFAPTHDPAVWEHGWYPAVAAAQAAATRATPTSEWWLAGSAEVLVVQPDDDVVAVAENAHQLVGELGARGRMVTVADAGHALLPEQPEVVASVLLDWLVSGTAAQVC